MIYFISDFHFGHKNIIEYGERPFASIEEMNEKIIANYNQTVSPEDTVYIVGDFCLGSPEHIKEYLSKFKKVAKLILVKGNHDRIKNAEMAREIGFDDMISNTVLEIEGVRIGLSHYPFKALGEMPSKYELRSEDVDLLVHGHVHQLYKTRVHESGKLMVNVSVEAIDYQPISIQDVLIIKR